MPTAVPPSASSCSAALTDADLLGVAAKFLTQPDGRCVHQMSAADFDDVVKLLRLRVERRGQFRERGNESGL